VAIPVIAEGIACLVEKPLAASPPEAAAIVDAAEASRTLLVVGHVERHNPAVQFLAGLIARGDVGGVLGLSAYRTGPMPTRVRDVGVVFDLVSHDLDILGWLIGEKPATLRGEAFGWTGSPRREAAVHVVARYPSDILATLDASWLHPAKRRRLHCLGTEGLVTVDYLQQEVRLTRNNYEISDWGPLAGLTGASLCEEVRYSVQRKEPLRAELEAFVAAARGDATCSMSGAEGLALIKLLAGLVADLQPEPSRPSGPAEPGALHQHSR
jgi:predicted dehydrogenase